MNKIKVLIFSIIFLLSFLIVPITKADIGPKPSLNLEIKYDLNAEIEVEFLVVKKNNQSYREKHDEYFPYSLEVYNYLKDEEFDGYISKYLTYGAPYGIKVSKDEEVFNVKATYRYPRNAKIIIIDKTNKKVFITNEFNQKAFDATVKIDLTKEINNDSFSEYRVIKNDLSLKEVHNINRGILLIFVRIILTVLIEVFILWIFRYKNKDSYTKVTMTNIITQTILSVLLFYTMYVGGSLTFIIVFVLAEIGVILIESITYIKILKEHSKGRTLIYGVLANIATIIIGFII